MSEQSIVLPAVAPVNVFQARLVALEQWLWSQGIRSLGLGTAAPRLRTLASKVMALSDVYTTDRRDIGAAASTADHLVAKVFYFLCSDAPKMFLVLRELADRYGDVASTKVLTRPLGVIDAGAGVGASAAGLLLSLDSRRVPRVRIHAIDADGAALRRWRTVAHQAAAIAGIELETQTLEMDLREANPDALREIARGRRDMMISQGLLNEMFADSDDPAGQRSAWLASWARQGVTLVIEPALRVTTRPLHQARDRLLAKGHVVVLAPCPHQQACPMLPNDRDWCHEVRQFPPTPMVAQVQEQTRRRDERTKFSFLVMAPRGTAPEVGHTSTSGRLVSDSLNSKGKLERFLCNGSGTLVRLRLLDKDRNAGNEALDHGERGALVRLEGDVTMPRLEKGTRVNLSPRFAPA